MDNSTIKFLKTREVKSPTRAFKHDAGIDFFVPTLTREFIKVLKEKNPQLDYFEFIEYPINEDPLIVLKPQERILIPSGIHCQMERSDRMLCAFNKSGIASKLGLVVGSCIVDFGYQGEIHLSLINTSDKDVKFTSGFKILQFIEMPIYTSDIEVEENKDIKEFYEKETERAEGGFSSSGV